jgi:hypothetical protein
MIGPKPERSLFCCGRGWERMLHWTPLDHGGSYSLAAMSYFMWTHTSETRRDETLNRVLTDIVLYLGTGKDCILHDCWID